MTEDNILLRPLNYDGTEFSPHLSRIIRNTDKNTSIFVVNPETGLYQLIRRDEHFSSKYIKKSGDFIEDFNAYIDQDVFEDDREELRKETSMQRIKERLYKEDSFTLTFRDTTSGRPLWFKMNVIWVSDSEYVVVGYEDDVETIKGLLYKRRYEDNFALFVVDVDSGLIKVLKESPWYETGSIGQAFPYQEVIRAYANSCEGETKEYFLKLSDWEYIKQIFETEDKRTYSYQSSHIKQRNGKKWVIATAYVIYRHKDGTPAIFTIGFSLIDSITSGQLELQRKLAKALEQAEYASKAKTTFLNNMSHDIRTPMNAIIGFNNMALKHLEEHPEKAKDCLIKVAQSSDTLLKLINDILEISRIESGTITVAESKGDVLLSFVNISAMLQELASEHNIDLSFNFGNVEDRYVLCDFIHCTRILSNLISNAIKYTHSGGWVKVTCTQTGRNDGYATYQYIIEDNGIGMSEEFQKHAFEQFSRENTSTVSKIQGSGLGLALCKDLTDALGGTISMKSKQGVGTTFTLELPFKIQQGTQEYVDPASNIVIHVRPSFNEKKVLLVEDNDLNREIATEILKEFGMRVDTADDGDVAVEKMKNANEGDYDIILMDIQMPHMNGYDATRAIRQMGSNIPIIAMTANAFEEDKKMAFEAGMNDHVAKPIDINILKKAISRFCN